MKNLKSPDIKKLLNKHIDRTSATKAPIWKYKLDIGSYPINITYNNN